MFGKRLSEYLHFQRFYLVLTAALRLWITKKLARRPALA